MIGQNHRIVESDVAILHSLGMLVADLFAFPWQSAPTYLVRDNNCGYGLALRSRLRAMGIRERPIWCGSPWQNAYVERLVGTLRRECLDGDDYRCRAFAAGPRFVCRLLQPDTHSFGAPERCEIPPRNPAVRTHHRHSDLGRTASSIRLDIIVGWDSFRTGASRRTAARAVRENCAERAADL
jgi:hypothetical protein